MSVTVTTELQLDVFPLLSLTVNVTLLFPELRQLNEEGLTVILFRLQLSDEPLLTCAAVIDAVPAPSR